LAIIFVGAVFGLSIAIGYITNSQSAIINELTDGSIILLVAISATLVSITFLLTQIAVRRIVLTFVIPPQFHLRYKSLDTITYFAFVLIIFGFIGLFIPYSFMLLLFIVSQLIVTSLSVSKSENNTLFTSINWLIYLFFVSGPIRPWAIWPRMSSPKGPARTGNLSFWPVQEMGEAHHCNTPIK
jgi:hypothetical protein